MKKKNAKRNNRASIFPASKLQKLHKHAFWEAEMPTYVPSRIALWVFQAIWFHLTGNGGELGRRRSRDSNSFDDPPLTGHIFSKHNLVVSCGRRLPLPPESGIVRSRSLHSTQLGMLYFGLEKRHVRLSSKFKSRLEKKNV